MKTRSSIQQSGAALILALVVLLMLMMLGLPFVMSQSVSLSGSVDFQARQEAGNGRDTGESLGIGLAVQANAEQFSDPNRIDSVLHEDLRTITGQRKAFSNPDDFGRVAIDTTELDMGIGETQRGRATTLVGVTLADESGKLDVNSMDAAAWHKLLEAVGIEDWDDDKTTDTLDENKYSPPDNDDHDEAFVEGDRRFKKNDIAYGELAEALARVRFYMQDRITSQQKLQQQVGGVPLNGTGRAINRQRSIERRRLRNLEELLKVDTYTHVGAFARAKGRRGLRRGLSKADLELLRPYITVHSTSQGRGGIADLGTVIGKSKWSEVGRKEPWHNRPIFDAYLDEVAKAGCAVVAREPDDHSGNFTFGYRASDRLDITAGGKDDANSLALGDPVAIDLPSPVNIHTAAKAVRYVVLDDKGSWGRNGSTATKVAVKRFSRYADLHNQKAPWGLHDTKVAWDLLNPLTNRYSRESIPLSLRSWGLTRIEAGSTATDLRHRSRADAYRSTLIQAMPQEQDIEITWDDQTDFYVLRGRRHGSRIVTWPKPRNRFEDERISDAPGDADTGIRPQPLWTIAHMGPDDRTDLLPKRQVDRSWTRIFAQQRRGAAIAPVTSAGVSPASDSKGSYGRLDVSPEGLVLGGGPLAWPISMSSSPKSNGNSNKRSGVLHAYTNKTNEVDGRHISFYFQPQQDWGAGQHTLMELPALSENQLPRWDGSVNKGKELYQNVWRVIFDADREYLVLELANPVIEHVVPYGHKIPEDDFTDGTVLTNEQSLGSDAGNLAKEDLAPPYPDLALKTRFFIKSPEAC